MDREKMIYSILTELDKRNRPDYKNYDVSKEYFADIIEFMNDNGFIQNAKIYRNRHGIFSMLIKDAKVTDKGYQYLKDNSAWAKAYNIAKEIRDWIK